MSTFQQKMQENIILVHSLIYTEFMAIQNCFKQKVLFNLEISKNSDTLSSNNYSQTVICIDKKRAVLSNMNSTLSSSDFTTDNLTLLTIKCNLSNN